MGLFFFQKVCRTFWYPEGGPQVIHYDRAGRFTGRTAYGSSSPLSRFNYDKNGNRVSGFDTERSFTAKYDDHDRLVQYNNSTYQYGLNGEISRVETGEDWINYSYDVFGNLTNVQTPNKNIQYITDGFNRRVIKSVDGMVKSRYVWQDQLRIAAELRPDGTLLSQFIYSDGINSPDYMIKDWKRYFFVKDHRDSILKVVDVETGAVHQELKYSEFGDVLQDTNPGFQPFGFAGGLYDWETKLVRFGARDYDGKIGRWLSKDPIRFDGGTPNLYEYVMNDPVNFVDLNGKAASYLGPILIGIGIITLPGLLPEKKPEPYNPDKYPKVQPPHPYPDNTDTFEEQYRKHKENKEFKDTVCSI